LFLQKNYQSNSSYPIFEPLKKSLNIILLLLELKDDFVELKMAILEQFKLLNLNQNKMRKLCTDEVGGVKRKRNEKNCAL
jgi:hypothetical protein